METIYSKTIFEKLDAYVYWKALRDTISDRCTWFSTPVEKEAMKCLQMRTMLRVLDF